MFEFSKIVAPLLDPLVLLLVAFAVAAVLAERGARETVRARVARRLLSAAAIVALAVWILPLGPWWLRAIETRFAPPDPPPARVAGIVVLGGDVDPGVARRAGAFSPGANGLPRLLAGAELARRYPEARLVFSGGSGSLAAPEDRDADAAGPLLLALGVAASRLTIEANSRNTWENAVEALALAKPAPGETWLLVTSAFHMPRAVGCFRRAGWTVTAWPVDYRADPDELPSLFRTPARRFAELHQAIRETVGLVVYRLLGRTDALWPGPGGS